MNRFISWNPFCLYTTQFHRNDYYRTFLDSNIVSAYPIESVNGIFVFITGTIYNIVKIKVDFQVQGDDPASVIAALYTKVGENVPLYLEGTYAIVILERTKMILFRDRFQVENLYYFRDDEQKAFIVSSSIDEIKQLKKLAVNEWAVPKYFLSSPIHGKMTLFRDIYTLETLELVVFDRMTGTWASRKYDDLPYHPLTDRGLDDSTIIEETDKLLHEGIRKLSEAYPTFQIVNSLSGGTDSSLMQVYLNDLGYRTSYTVSHPPPGGSDVEKYATDIARIFKLDHRLIEVDPADLLKNLEEGIKICGQPFIFEGETLAQVMNRVIAADGAKHGKEVIFLDGNGADTVVGYGRFLLELKFLSHPMLRYLFSLVNYGVVQFIFPLEYHRYRVIIDVIAKNRFDAEFLPILFDKGRQIQLIKDAFQLQSVGSLYEYEYEEMEKFKVPLIEKIYRLRTIAYNLNLQNNITYQSAKAQHLLAAFPYTNTDFVTFYFNIPSPRKIRGFGGRYFKYFLKRLLERYIPKKYVYRKKIHRHKYTSFVGIISKQVEYSALIDEIKTARYPYFNFDLDLIFGNSKHDAIALHLINFHLWHKHFIAS